MQLLFGWILFGCGLLICGYVIKRVWSGAVPPPPPHPAARARARHQRTVEDYLAHTPQIRRLRVARRRTIDNPRNSASPPE